MPPMAAPASRRIGPPPTGRRRAPAMPISPFCLAACRRRTGRGNGTVVDVASSGAAAAPEGSRTPLVLPGTRPYSAASWTHRARAPWRRGGCQASARVRLLFYLVRRSPSGNLFVRQKQRGSEEKRLMCECACVAAHRPSRRWRPSGPPKWPPAGGRSARRRRGERRRWPSEMMRPDNERRGG